MDKYIELWQLYFANREDMSKEERRVFLSFMKEANRPILKVENESIADVEKRLMGD